MPGVPGSMISASVCRNASDRPGNERPPLIQRPIINSLPTGLFLQ